MEIAPIKPRTSFPKEKPKVAQSPQKGKSLIDRIKDIIPEVQAAEVTINGTVYDIPDEIINLSAQLENNPALIYAYVRDEVEYTPYYGLMKGSLWTSWEKVGNYAYK